MVKSCSFHCSLSLSLFVQSGPCSCLLFQRQTFLCVCNSSVTSAILWCFTLPYNFIRPRKISLQSGQGKNEHRWYGFMSTVCSPIQPTCISKFCQHQQQTEKKKRRNDNQITRGKWWEFGKVWRGKLDGRQTGLGESVFVVFFFSTRRVETNVGRFLSCDTHYLQVPITLPPQLPCLTTPVL